MLALRARRVANRAKTTSRVQQYSFGFAQVTAPIGRRVALGRAGHDVYATMRNAAPRRSLGSINANGVSSIISAVLAANRAPITALENVVISTGRGDLNPRNLSASFSKCARVWSSLAVERGLELLQFVGILFGKVDRATEISVEEPFVLLVGASSITCIQSFEEGKLRRSAGLRQIATRTRIHRARVSQALPSGIATRLPRTCISRAGVARVPRYMQCFDQVA